jgi:hypothetical protein
VIFGKVQGWRPILLFRLTFSRTGFGVSGQVWSPCHVAFLRALVDLLAGFALAFGRLEELSFSAIGLWAYLSKPSFVFDAFGIIPSLHTYPNPLLQWTVISYSYIPYFSSHEFVIAVPSWLVAGTTCTERSAMHRVHRIGKRSKTTSIVFISMKGNHYGKPKLRSKDCMASKPGILKSGVRHLIEEADKV